MTTGGRNLIILGVASVIIAFATTSVSLALYHNSGDIYLDRSRPGFLPDEEEIEKNEPDIDYVFEKSGKINKTVIDEYIGKLQIEIKAIESYDKPFSEAVLSDEQLGL